MRWMEHALEFDFDSGKFISSPLLATKLHSAVGSRIVRKNFEWRENVSHLLNALEIDLQKQAFVGMTETLNKAGRALSRKDLQSATDHLRVARKWKLCPVVNVYVILKFKMWTMMARLARFKRKTCSELMHINRMARWSGYQVNDARVSKHHDDVMKEGMLRAKKILCSKYEKHGIVGLDEGGRGLETEAGYFLYCARILRILKHDDQITSHLRISNTRECESAVLLANHVPQTVDKFMDRVKEQEGKACKVCSVYYKINLACSRCKRAYYCCRRHQKMDWSRHRMVCGSE